MRHPPSRRGSYALALQAAALLAYIAPVINDVPPPHGLTDQIHDLDHDTTYQIFVALPDGKTTLLHTHKNDLVHEILTRLPAREGVPSSAQRALCHGLSRSNTIHECGIAQHSRITILYRTIGGTGRRPIARKPAAATVPLNPPDADDIDTTLDVMAAMRTNAAGATARWRTLLYACIAALGDSDDRHSAADADTLRLLDALFQPNTPGLNKALIRDARDLLSNESLTTCADFADISGPPCAPRKARRPTLPSSAPATATSSRRRPPRNEPALAPPTGRSPRAAPNADETTDPSLPAAASAAIRSPPALRVAADPGKPTTPPPNAACPRRPGLRPPVAKASSTRTKRTRANLLVQAGEKQTPSTLDDGPAGPATDEDHAREQAQLRQLRSLADDLKVFDHATDKLIATRDHQDGADRVT